MTRAPWCLPLLSTPDTHTKQWPTLPWLHGHTAKQGSWSKWWVGGWLYPLPCRHWIRCHLWNEVEVRGHHLVTILSDHSPDHINWLLWSFRNFKNIKITPRKRDTAPEWSTSFYQIYYSPPHQCDIFFVPFYKVQPHLSFSNGSFSSLPCPSLYYYIIHNCWPWAITNNATSLRHWSSQLHPSVSNTL